MTVLSVLTVPDPRLRTKAKPVREVNDHIRSILNDMVETMYAEEGIGLAATQVDIHLRLVVLDLSSDEEKTPVFKMVNPTITWKSDETEVGFEACLSVPEQRAQVERSTALHLEYLDEQGEPHTIEAEGFFAVAIQHELDHLEGKLYIDYLPSLKKTMLISKVKRLLRH